MTEISTQKNLLRAQIRASLAHLSEADKSRESSETLDRLVAYLKANPEVKTVASYAATATELSLDSLHNLLPHLTVCYPRCEGEGLMAFHAVHDLSEMKRMKMGIREPDMTLHRKIAPDEIDVYLCPAYAYTPDGERLGKGGGYYDRYLLKKKAGATSLGVVFKCQKLPSGSIPCEPHDLSVDRVL